MRPKKRVLLEPPYTGIVKKRVLLEPPYTGIVKKRVLLEPPYTEIVKSGTNGLALGFFFTWRAVDSSHST